MTNLKFCRQENFTINGVLAGGHTFVNSPVRKFEFSFGPWSKMDC